MSVHSPSCGVEIVVLSILVDKLLFYQFSMLNRRSQSLKEITPIGCSDLAIQSVRRENGSTKESKGGED